MFLKKFEYLSWGFIVFAESNNVYFMPIIRDSQDASQTEANGRRFLNWLEAPMRVLAAYNSERLVHSPIRLKW